jgi:hypothetical protein
LGHKIDRLNLFDALGTESGDSRSIIVPRYYFHLFNDMNVPDDEGEDLPDLAAAESFSLRQARALIAAAVTDHGRIVLSHRIEIEDDRHDLVGTVRFRDAVTIEA